jgi:hypothetical protein
MLDIVFMDGGTLIAACQSPAIPREGETLLFKTVAGSATYLVERVVWEATVGILYRVTIFVIRAG